MYRFLARKLMMSCSVYNTWLFHSKPTNGHIELTFVMTVLRSEVICTIIMPGALSEFSHLTVLAPLLSVCMYCI